MTTTSTSTGVTGGADGALRAARDGGSVGDIARSVLLSEGTVRNHLSATIGKTAARNHGDAVRFAEENGWL